MSGRGHSLIYHVIPCTGVMFACAPPHHSLGRENFLGDIVRVSCCDRDIFILHCLNSSPQHDFYRPDLCFFRVLEARTSRMVHHREIFHPGRPQRQTAGETEFSGMCTTSGPANHLTLGGAHAPHMLWFRYSRWDPAAAGPNPPHLFTKC